MRKIERVRFEKVPVVDECWESSMVGCDLVEQLRIESESGRSQSLERERVEGARVKREVNL